MFWKRKETFIERRLTSVRREMRLVDGDMDALARTVRSGGRVPVPNGLRSEEWRRRQAEEAESEMLPEWFPRPDQGGNEPVRSDRGFVRDERFVDYLASNFHPAPKDREDERDRPVDRRWILVGLVAILVLLYSLARHWL